jgi:hypothetical protein
MSGWLALSKKSAERRCVSRLEFFVSMDAAPTVRMPLTPPDAVTVPFPLTWRNTPLTGARPHMPLLRSPIADLEGSRAQFPASAAPLRSACGSCPVDAMPSSISVPLTK